MTIKQLDHVNLRTADVAGMVAFYRDLLGFEVGPRPPFRFGGAWLYCGGQAAVHLVEVGSLVREGDERLIAVQTAAPGEVLRIAVVGGYPRPLPFK